MHEFFLDEIPSTSTVAGWLKANTDWVRLGETTRVRRMHPKMMRFRIEDLDLPAMQTSIKEALTLYGDHRWRTGSGTDAHYSGFSLTYNPELRESVDLHASTLGTTATSADRLGDYDDMGDSDEVKDTYYDTYGFRVPTPASAHGELGRFMERSVATRVRSRLAIIDGSKHMYRHRFMGWHVDEPIYQNLRINVPITTSEKFMFQFEGDEPMHLEPGYAYAFDPHIRHRVFSTERSPVRRVHLVLGFSPWWDYDSERRSWRTNRFYGVKHPLDMLTDGEIIRGLVSDDSRPASSA